MLAPWAIEEMRTAKLRDKRLNKRLTRILSALGSGRRPVFYSRSLRGETGNGCRVSVLR